MNPIRDTDKALGDVLIAIQSLVEPMAQAVQNLGDAITALLGAIEIADSPLFPALAFYALVQQEKLESVFLLGNEVFDAESEQYYPLPNLNRLEMLAVLQRIKAARARAQRLAPPSDEWLQVGSLPERWAYQAKIWGTIWGVVTSPARFVWGILKAPTSDKDKQHD